LSGELRNEWVCSECSVRVYNVGGAPFPAPTGWHHETETCLACSKKDETPQQRTRRMLLEDETVNKISRACRGINKVEINATRTRLIEAGELSPDANNAKPGKEKRKKPEGDERQSAKRERAEAALRANPGRPTKEIAEEVGVSSTLVWRTKKQMMKASEG
jgi:DNA-directed RNA polymerase specialized sigma subunit